VGNTHTNGTGSLTGTIRYIGTGTSFTDNVGLSGGTQYWYKVYTVDKAFNYSDESVGNGTTSVGDTPLVTVGSITGFGNQTVNTTSTEKSYSVSGSNLDANIVITPPAGFEISLTSGSGFIANPNTIELTPEGGSVESTTSM
jgi:trimeric autotransporter adhesin